MVRVAGIYGVGKNGVTSLTFLSLYISQIEKYLALPEGFRFLVAGDYEDVWQDKGLIGI